MSGTSSRSPSQHPHTPFGATRLRPVFSSRSRTVKGYRPSSHIHRLERRGGRLSAGLLRRVQDFAGGSGFGRGMAAIHRKKIMAVRYYKDSTYTVKDPFQVSTEITVITVRHGFVLFCQIIDPRFQIALACDITKIEVKVRHRI